MESFFVILHAFSSYRGDPVTTNRKQIAFLGYASFLAPWNWESGCTLLEVVCVNMHTENKIEACKWTLGITQRRRF